LNQFKAEIAKGEREIPFALFCQFFAWTKRELFFWVNAPMMQQAAVRRSA